MALDTYAGLKTTMQSWMARVDLASEIDDFIDLFEAWANRNLRVPQMEQEALADASEFLPFPDDFLELRDIQWQGSPIVQLEYVTPSFADFYNPSGTAGIPHYYTVLADQFRLVPAPSSTPKVRIDYWQKIPALSNVTTTNWLLTAHPDAYLYGSLIHAKMRITDPELAATLTSGWAMAMDELKRAGKKTNLGSMLATRPM